MNNELANAMVSSLTPDDPEALSQFTIDILDEWESDGGIGWSAEISAPSGISFAVENDGMGERNRYLAHDAQAQALFIVFQQASQKAFPTSDEPEDYACLWLEVRDLWEELPEN